MVVFISWLVCLCYMTYMGVVWVGWIKIKRQNKSTPLEEMGFSIIIPVRNEVGNIYRLLKDINQQLYDKSKYEVLVVDDHSEDHTIEEVREAIDQLDIEIQLIDLSIEGNYRGKKQAITKAIEKAKFEYVVCTDGDCRVNENWLNQYNLTYQQANAEMVLGPVAYTESDQLFKQIQKIEFLALIGIGGGSLSMGMPTFCNGANLSYSKKVFNEVSGYAGNEQVPSGDDEFLLQKIYNKYPSKVSFNKSHEALVITDAKESPRDFLNQRIRWSAKWKYHKSNRMKIWGAMMFLFQCSLTILTVGLFGTALQELFLATFFVRLILEYVFINQVKSDLIREDISVLKTIVLQVIYPFYTILLMLLSLLGRYSWKGRFYL